MKYASIICAIALLAGCATQNKLLPKETAIQIAAEAAALTGYGQKDEILAELDGSTYCITFPADKSVPPGTRYRGPDYTAKVWIDAKSGKVLQVKIGS